MMNHPIFTSGADTVIVCLIDDLTSTGASSPQFVGRAVLDTLMSFRYDEWRLIAREAQFTAQSYCETNFDGSTASDTGLSLIMADFAYDMLLISHQRAILPTWAGRRRRVTSIATFTTPDTEAQFGPNLYRDVHVMDDFLPKPHQAERLHYIHTLPRFAVDFMAILGALNPQELVALSQECAGAGDLYRTFNADVSALFRISSFALGLTMRRPTEKRTSFRRIINLANHAANSQPPDGEGQPGPNP